MLQRQLVARETSRSSAQRPLRETAAKRTSLLINLSGPAIKLNMPSDIARLPPMLPASRWRRGLAYVKVAWSAVPITSARSRGSNDISSLKSLVASARLYSAMVSATAESAITSALGPPTFGMFSPSVLRPARARAHTPG